MFVTRADLLNLQNNFGSKLIGIEGIINVGDVDVYKIGSS